MTLPPFATEQWFDRFEFRAPHLLSSSDCESVTIAELLELAGAGVDDLAGLRLGYTEMQGHPELRAAVAGQYRHVTADDVVVLNSPIEGIYLTMRVLAGRGSGVVALAPAFDPLLNLPEALAHRFQQVAMAPTVDGWHLDLDDLRAAVASSPGLVVANFPHNPTGYQPTHDEFHELVEIVTGAGAVLYHDEMFRGLEHGDRPTLPSAADLSASTVVLAGLSKTYGLPGLRAGWLVVRDSDLRTELMNWKMYTSICAPAPTEYLARLALGVADRLAARSNALIRSNLALADEFFAAHEDRFRWRRPLAGPVALVESLGEEGVALAERFAVHHGVVLLPARFMRGGDEFFRIGLGRRSFPQGLAAFAAAL